MKFTILILSLLFGILLLPGTVVPACAENGPEIRIQGLAGEPLNNVREALRPAAGLFADGAFNQLWLNRYLRLAPGRVARALEPFGYYGSSVELKVDRQASPPVIHVQVAPGPQVRIATRRLELVGYRHRQLTRKLDSFPLAPGDPLEHLRYEQAKAELQALAVDLGYLDAHYSVHRILVDRDAASADLELVLETGPRYRFGPMRIVGGEEYPERFLRRYLAAHPGEVFSHAALGQTQRQFLDSDRFSSVIISVLREQTEDQAVPVQLRLESKAPKRLRPGIGYGTDTGARLFLRYQDVNVRGLGHEFDSNLLLAERQQNLIVNYQLPGYQNVDTLLALRGGYQSEDLDVYETSYGFAEVERIYGFSAGRTGSFFVRYQQESSTISGTAISSGTLMPGLRLRIGKLDDQIRPTRGYRLSAELRGTWAALVSDLTLLQALGDIHWISPLRWGTYLSLRGSAATTLQQDDFAELPASLRFFTGGDGSVRGYAYQTLGPTDALGQVIGGKHLLVGSAELEKRFLSKWGMAVFYDVGNAFNTFADYDLAHGAGIGARYFTPVGPVRVDLARTIGADQVSYRLHIGLGIGW